MNPLLLLVLVTVAQSVYLPPYTCNLTITIGNDTLTGYQINNPNLRQLYTRIGEVEEYVSYSSSYIIEGGRCLNIEGDYDPLFSRAAKEDDVVYFRTDRIYQKCLSTVALNNSLPINATVSCLGFKAVYQYTIDYNCTLGLSEIPPLPDACHRDAGSFLFAVFICTLAVVAVFLISLPH